MNIRAKLATVAGKSTKFILEKTRGGGSSLPGKVAMKLDPAVLAELSKDYRDQWQNTDHVVHHKNFSSKIRKCANQSNRCQHASRYCVLFPWS